MTKQVALYARYSTDMQSEASIEDQFRVCRDYAKQQGWHVIDSYSDRAISGASIHSRKELQQLVHDASQGKFDIVLSEALDRLSRDQEDIAGIYKRLKFSRTDLCTVSEGEISEIHIGLKGTMNALFLKDLAAKTHRGLTGRIKAGKSAGGICYGYSIPRHLKEDGSLSTGERQINEAEAIIVQRIFHDFAAGKSPRQIAVELNKEGHPAPGGRDWGQSTINGHAERGTGILNNELYIGRLVWNRLKYMKSPHTGKRISSLNPRADWIEEDVPDLRIIENDLWQAVKDRQQTTRHRTSSNAMSKSDITSHAGFWSHQRPKHLLTGLVRCGCCAGAYSKISATLFGCAAARNKGTCDNRLNIRVDKLDDIVLSGLKGRLMDPDIYAEFLKGFITEQNSLIAQRNSQYISAEAELTKLKSRQKSLLQALTDGVPARTIKDELISLESKEDALNELLRNRPAAEPSLHPNLANLYRDKVAALHEALSDPATKDEAFTIIRTLIEEVRLIPEDGELRVELRGALAGILALGVQNKRTARVGTAGSLSVLAQQIKLVAGTGFEPVTFRL